MTDRYLQIGGVTWDEFGNTEALRVRVGSEKKWEWRKITAAEYDAMLRALNQQNGTEEG